jgi:hypothetical protein
MHAFTSTHYDLTAIHNGIDHVPGRSDGYETQWSGYNGVATGYGLMNEQLGLMEGHGLLTSPVSPYNLPVPYCFTWPQPK